VPRLPAWLDDIRKWVVFVLIALHVIAITVMAFPSPGGGLDRRDWRQPTVRAEFEAWNERLAALGWTGTTDELQDELYGIARGYASAHHQLKKPFFPYYRCCGTGQSWRMFVAPHMHPSRFQVRIRDGRVWYVVYEARHPEHRWLANVFDHDRMRAVLFRYGWGRKYPTNYEQLGDWIAQQALRDFPQADMLQIRFASYRTLSPEQVRAGERADTRWHRTRKISLIELRQEASADPAARPADPGEAP